MFRDLGWKLVIGVCAIAGLLSGSLPGVAARTSVFCEHNEPLPAQDEEEKDKESKETDWWNRRSQVSPRHISSKDAAVPLPHKPAASFSPRLASDSLHSSPFRLVPLRC